jgi:glucose/arabinose dehydrogenase
LYNTIPPLWRWTPTIAPTGAAFYTGGRISGWQNHLFVCAFNDDRMRHVYLNPTRTTVTAVTLLENTGPNGVNCSMDVQTGYDGALYYIEGGGYNPGTLKRIVGTLPPLPYRQSLPLVMK